MGLNGTGYEGPLHGDHRSNDGLFEGVGLGIIDGHRTPFKVFPEDFDVQMADGELAVRGATVTARGSAIAATEVVTGAAPYLLINPGTAADTGTNIQFNGIASGTGSNEKALRSLGPITSTTTLMDNRELFFQTRIGIMSDTTAWDGKVMFGWLVEDSALMSTGTGVPTLGAGGGFGFHIGETGVISYFSTEDTLTAITTATVTGSIGTNVVALDAAATFQYYTFGARMRCVDASAGTGVTEFFVNGRSVAEIVDNNCMDSTETFAFGIEVINGPARDSDVALDYLITGISRDGLTFPYDRAANGVW